MIYGLQAGDRRVSIRRRRPLDSSIREKLTKRGFATVGVQSGGRYFDLVVDLIVRTADPIELEVQRDCCLVIWNENGAQVAA